MKKIIALISILPAFAIAASAQNQQNQQIQSNCRDISAGGFIGPDEVIMQTQSGYVACRVFKLLPAAAKNETAPAPAPAPAPAAAPAPAPTPVLAPVPVTRVGLLGRPHHLHRASGSVGYEWNSANLYGYGASTPRAKFNGFFAQGIVNASRYVSIIGNLDGSYHSEQASGYQYDNSGNAYLVTFKAKLGLVSYTGGVQGYPLGRKRLQPFGRFAVGATTLFLDSWSDYFLFGGGCQASCRHTGFTYTVGGGFDYKLNPEGRLAFRLGQFDYSHASKQGVNLGEFKVGGGIVF